MTHCSYCRWCRRPRPWNRPGKICCSEWESRSPTIPRPSSVAFAIRRSPRHRSAHRAQAPPADDDGGSSDDHPAAGPAAHPQPTARLTTTSSLKVHPDAALVPEMRPAEYTALVADVRERGITTPLELVGDVVLDGRHRLRAALDLGLAKVPVVELTLGSEDQTAHLLKAAVLRRHLSDDQRALVAAKWAHENAKPRGGDRRSSTAKAIKRADVGPIDPHPTRAAAAALMSVPATRVKRAAQLLAEAPDLATQVHTGTLKLSHALRRVQRQAQLHSVATTDLPEGVFTTIVADPPWRYDDDRTRGAAHHHYPTMTAEEICALPVGANASENCHLYLWVTATLLEEGFAVLRTWGFTYKTVLTWVKPQFGLGRYFRGATEHVLFATRGNLPLKDQGLPNWFKADRRAHSEKPEAFFEMVEKASPAPYLELFARRQRPGWATWGAEAGAAPAPGILGEGVPVNGSSSDPGAQ